VLQLPPTPSIVIDQVLANVFYLSFFNVTVAECDLVVFGTAGDNVTLPCKYDAETIGVVAVCWGQGTLPYSKCNHPLVSTDGTRVYEGSAAAWPGSRYRLLGDLRNGDVSMTILNASESDSGIYGCRVEIPGWFNDHKNQVELRVQKGEIMG